MRRRHYVKRFVRFVRALFSSGSTSGDSYDDRDAGGIGVREPRRPLSPSLSGTVALKIPPGETRDVGAIGEDDSR